LVAYLHDNVDAWRMNADGHYTRVTPEKARASRSKAQPAAATAGHGAQAALMALHAAKM